eukprot:gene5848-6089_t
MAAANPSDLLMGAHSVSSITDQPMVKEVHAEAQSSAVLRSLAAGKAHPLLALPMRSEVNPQGMSFVVTPFAGNSLSSLRGQGGAWAHLPPDKLHSLSLQLATSLLTAQAFYSSVDLKLDNLCALHGADGGVRFVVIDHGAMCSVDLDGFFYALDMRGPTPLHHPTLDLFHTGQALLEFYWSSLPDEVNLVAYPDGEEGMAAYTAAAQSFDWATCPQVQQLPPLMRGLVSWLLATDVNDRPQSAKQALQHPWIKSFGALQQLSLQVKASAPAWQ